MCEKCNRLETTIQRYREFAQSLDPLTVERINALILELQQRRKAMHQGKRVGPSFIFDCKFQARTRPIARCDNPC
jgi:hypothetical protein